MNQARTLLILRIKQVYRYLNEIGFGLIAVALFVLTGFLMNTVQTIITTPNVYALLVGALLLLFIEFKRKDQFFLAGIFQDKNALIRYKIIENGLIISPLLVFQFFVQQWINTFLLIVIAITIALITSNLRYTSRKDHKISIPFIPLSIFEIKFYFEKSIIMLILPWILLWLGGIHISLWILGIFIVCTLPLEIYTPLESRIMLNYRPNFVASKILNATKFFFILAIPPTLFTAFFYDGNVLIFGYGILALLVSISLAIGKKYYEYYGVLEKSPSSTSVMILVFLMLLPGGILITILAAVYYYFRAEKHMKSTYGIT